MIDYEVAEMAKMLKKYERLLISGEYSSINEMCNDLGLNYDEIYEDEPDDDYEEDFQIKVKHTVKNSSRRKK